MKKEVEIWIQKAENDLLNIENNLKSDTIPFDTICFHCQQVAEKYLKAFLVGNNIEFPKTHDLVEIIENCCINIIPAFKDIKQEAAILSDYGVTPRYPDEYFEPTESDANEAYQATLKIKEFVLSVLANE